MGTKVLATCKGFTLVELMVTVGILAFLGIVSATTFFDTPNWVSHQRMKASARQLALNLQYAKMEAVKRNSFCTLAFNQPIGAETYSYVVFADTNGDLKYDAGEPVLAQVSLPNDNGVIFDTSQGGGDGLTFADNSQGRPSMAFDPRGLPRNYVLLGSPPSYAGGSAFIKDSSGNQMCVAISNAGRIKVQ